MSFLPHHRWPFNLRAALMLAVVFPLVVAMTVTGVLVLREFERQAISRMEEDVELVARAIRIPLSRAMESGEEGSIDDALASAFRIGRVYGAHLYDQEGELVSSFGAAATGEDPGRISELVEDESRQGEYGEAGREEVYSYFVSLTSSGNRPVGLLQVTRRRSDIDGYVNQLRFRAGSALLIGLLVAGGLVLAGHRRVVGRYLDRLLESMGRVGQGDREHRTTVKGPTEISRLASGLNAMLDSIARAEDELAERRAEQLRLESELRQTEKMAAVGRLSAGVAHELGSPLGSVDGRAQRILRRAEDLPSDLAEEVRALRHDTARMEEIVRQLLEFGRGIHGSRRPVRADRLVRGAVSAVEEEADAVGVTLVADGADPPPTLLVDARGVERALVNLVRNAIHATPGGTVEVRWLAESDDVAGFEVADDGEGVPDAIRDRIFEPFFTTKETGRGTGLGLAVVHGIAREHGGGVEVRPGRMGGAAFRMTVSVDGAGAGPGTEADARPGTEPDAGEPAATRGLEGRDHA